ncbi:MAG: sugar ABC transporter substrate-binding protein [Chloroflexi bacterium]|nr:sugar ABC transporter substrate-binding protein [Chloroflexota bacterium]
MLRKIVPLLIVIGALLLTLPQVTHAAAVACAKDYSVQADDWLSKSSEKEFGSTTAYPAIALATNMKHAEDSSYALIVDPNRIEVGWKLCIPSAEDAKTLNATRYKILMDTKGPGSGNPFWRKVEVGGDDAAKAWGVVTLAHQAPPEESDVQTQIKQLEDALTTGTQGLVLAATDKVALNSTLDKYKAANVPVVTIDSDADSPVKLSFIGTDNKAGGKLQGQYVCKLLGAGAKVGLIEGNLTAQSIADRVAGAKEGLATCNANVVKELSEGTHSIAGGQKLAEDIMTANPDVQALIAINDNQALGALAAAKAAGKTLVIIGYDANPDAVKSVAEGGLAATIAQRPANMGIFGVNWIMVALTGNAKEISNRIDTGTALVTKENAAQFQ